jgi:hypothetical protein
MRPNGLKDPAKLKMEQRTSVGVKVEQNQIIQIVGFPGDITAVGGPSA